ncbi:DJ-1/PfpI family protein [Myxococcus sp. 1LA]
MTLSPFAVTLLATWLAATPPDDVEAIRAVLTDYTEGVKAGDGARLQRAFPPTTDLLHLGEDGGLAVWPGADFIQRVVKQPSPEREDAILQVDIFGSAAMAKVAIRTSRSYFVDYISLLKLGGKWRIVSKVFHRMPREERAPRAAPASTTAPVSGPLAGRTVAMLLTHHFNLPEMAETRRALEEAGARVELVAPNAGTVRAEARAGHVREFQVDRALSDARPDTYHALYLPGGTLSADSLRIAPGAVDFVQAFLRAKKPVAAICHGVWLLADAGGVKGRRVTSFPSVRRDMQNAGATWVDEPVVVDGPLVTSRQMSDLPAFNSQVVARFARAASP